VNGLLSGLASRGRGEPRARAEQFRFYGQPIAVDPSDPIVAPQWREAQSAPDQLGVQLLRLKVRNADELRRTFQTAADGKTDAVLRLSGRIAIRQAPKTSREFLMSKSRIRQNSSR